MFKRNFKKLATGLLAAVMVAGTALSGAVQAAPIVGPTPTSGSLTINKTDAGGTALKGAGFTLYKIMDLIPGTNAGEYAEFEAVSHYSSELVKITPDALKNYSAADIEALTDQLLALTATDPDAIDMALTAEGTGMAKQTGLELGYYMVVETTVPNGHVASSPFFVAIPSTDNYNNSSAVGTTWTYDVVVAPKNASVPLDKVIVKGSETAEKDTVSYGDTIEFRTTTQIPAFANEYFEAGTPIFKITDKATDGIVYDNTDNKVFVMGDSDWESITEGTDTFSWTDGSSDSDPDFTVTFAKKFLQDYAGKDVKIEYQATVTEDILVGTSTSANNYNTATLTYSRNPQVLTDVGTLEDKVEVYSFEIAIEKFAKVNGSNSLIDTAKFELYSDAACTTKVFNATYSTVDGVLTFPSIKEGTYYIKEVEAPTGYKLLVNPIKVVLTATKTANALDGGFTVTVDGTAVSAGTTAYVSRIDTAVSTGKTIVAVQNTKGFTLPATGGMGIAIFTLIGFAAIAFISVKVFAKKKAN
ncbi:fimbrial isopeptide formation D2 family protein/LPXTG-motif cell wall-anchored protein [Lachnospiraceae bacterium PF1-22]